MNEYFLQYRTENFHRRAASAVCFANHRVRDFVPLEYSLIVLTGLLNTGGIAFA
jgi:hypothetical protein